MNLTVFTVFLEWEEGRISLSTPDLFEQADPERRWGLGLLWLLYSFLSSSLTLRHSTTFYFRIWYSMCNFILALQYQKLNSRLILFSTRVSCSSVCLFPSVSLENIGFLKPWHHGNRTVQLFSPELCVLCGCWSCSVSLLSLSCLVKDVENPDCKGLLQGWKLLLDFGRWKQA